VTEEAARRPATSVFPTEANRSEAPLLGVERGIGTLLRLGQGRVETSLLSRFPPPNPPIGPITPWGLCKRFSGVGSGSIGVIGPFGARRRLSEEVFSEVGGT
jgi:hypothetical protein